MNINSRGYHLWVLIDRHTNKTIKTEYKSQSAVNNDNEIMANNGDGHCIWVLDDVTEFCPH